MALTRFMPITGMCVLKYFELPDYFTGRHFFKHNRPGNNREEGNLMHLRPDLC